jgi:hypothetical protein
MRYIFWIGLALVVCRGVAHGLEIVPVACVVGGLILIAAITRGGRDTRGLPRLARRQRQVGADRRHGLRHRRHHHRHDDADRRRHHLRRLDHRLGAKSLFLALVMTMLLSILLGTGSRRFRPTSSPPRWRQPALAKLGVPLIASHMFAFYYGIMADLSPPVALAALAAAPIAKGKPRQDRLGGDAHRARGLRHPFIFVYSPALMLQAGDPMASKLGFYGAVALATFKALVAIGLFGIIAIGFLFTRLTWPNRRRRGRGAVPARRFPFSDPGFACGGVVLWQAVRATVRG